MYRSLHGVDYGLKFNIFPAADQTRMMQDQMTGMAMGMPQDSSKAFKVHISDHTQNCTY